MKEKLTKNKVLEISKDCLTTHDLYLKGKNVYEFVRRNNLWSEIPWVKRNETKPQKYWKNKENIDEYAKKCKTRKEFYTKYPSAYYASLKDNYIDKFSWLSKYKKIDFSKEKDCIYGYFFNDLNYAYIGRTIMERVENRDKEHFSENKNEPTFRFIKAHNCQRPKMIILEKNIPLKNGPDRERYWAEYYKNKGFKLINSLPCGGLGSLGGGKWDAKNVIEESKKYKTRGEFAKKQASAYKFALKNNLLNKMWWLSTQQKVKIGFWCVKSNVIEESKKYKSRNEFYKKNNSAYRSAIKFGWINEMTWLSNERKHKKGYWTNQKLFEECKKYKNRTELIKNNLVVYILLKKKKLLSNNLFNG